MSIRIKTSEKWTDVFDIAIKLANEELKEFFELLDKEEAEDALFLPHTGITGNVEYGKKTERLQKRVRRLPRKTRTDKEKGGEE